MKQEGLRLLLRTTFVLLLATFLPLSSAAAETWDKLPEEMVMISPQLESVTAGIAASRLVHASFESNGDYTNIKIRFLGSSLDLPIACDVPDEGCLPNARGFMELRARNMPVGNQEDMIATIKVGSEWTIDKPLRDRVYYMELLGTFMANDVEIRKDGDKWIITGADDTLPTVWRPMSLKTASDTVYFIKELQWSLFETGQCVIDQVAQIATRDGLSESEIELVDSVSVLADKARSRAIHGPAKRNEYPDAWKIAMSAQYLSGDEHSVESAEGFSETSIFDALAEDTEAEQMLRANFDRIKSTAFYLAREAELSRKVPAEKRKAIICRDLSELEIP